MGIRCYCPNKHRVHVKAFLAGQRGICPECGARFIIPQESDPTILPRSKRKAAAEAAVSEAAPSEVPSAADLEDVETSVLVDEVGLPPSAVGSTSLPKTDSPAASGGYVPPPPTAAATADPITAGGLSMWYVRHADGGQYGPAPPEIFRAWLTEGRIGPDSLVWREGWPQWQPGREVFAQLRPAAVSAAPPPPPAPMAASVAAAVTADLDFAASAPRSSARAARDRRKSNSLALLVVLALIVIGLIPVLILVISR